MIFLGVGCVAADKLVPTVIAADDVAKVFIKFLLDESVLFFIESGDFI
jgi:hypothetical protein